MPSPVATTWIDIAPGFAGYLATPPGGSGPGLVMWQEIFGVNAHIRAMAEAYAADGYVVLAPDAFWRRVPRMELGYEPEDWPRARAEKQAYALDEAAADCVAAAAVLRARPETAGRRLGTIGWCMGGWLAYLSAAAGVVDAAVAYYGGGIQNLLERASGVRAPMQFHYAERDEHIPPAAVQVVRAALPAAEVHVYSGAQHGFNCPARASWHAPSAALAHGRSLQFLTSILHAG
jgi:carboxymethylenebutenolidase